MIFIVLTLLISYYLIDLFFPMIYTLIKLIYYNILKIYILYGGSYTMNEIDFIGYNGVKF